jgi:hypothetical protein
MTEKQGDGATRPGGGEASWSGTLDATPLVQVMWTLARKQAVGELELSGKTRARIYVHKGRVARVLRDPVPPGNRLGELLVVRREITPEQCDAALASATRRKVPLGQELVATKVLEKNQLAGALHRQLQARLVAVAEVASGKFTFVPNAPIGEEPVSPPIDPLKTLFRAIVDGYTRRLPDEVKAAEADVIDLFLYPGEEPAEGLADLGLSDRESRFCREAVTGRYRLREAYSISKISRRNTHGLVFALRDLGFAKFERKMDPARRASELTDSIETKHGEIRSATLFDFLEVHWGALGEEIEEAHAKMRAEFGEVSGLPPEAGRKCKEILTHIDEARDRLSAKEERQRYRRTLIQDEQLRFAANLLAQQGDMAMFRRDFACAQSRYAHAAEIWPGLSGIAGKLRSARMGIPLSQ